MTLRNDVTGDWFSNMDTGVEIPFEQTCNTLRSMTQTEARGVLLGFFVWQRRHGLEVKKVLFLTRAGKAITIDDSTSR